MVRGTHESSENEMDRIKGGKKKERLFI